MVFSVLLLYSFLENFMFQNSEKPTKWKSPLIAYGAWSKTFLLPKP